MKETKIFNNNEVLANLAKETVKEEDRFLADKDKAISELKEKITDLERQNNDLDYLLNSGRNKFEHERNKRLKELETKLNQQTKLIIEGKEFEIIKYPHDEYDEWYIKELTLVLRKENNRWSLLRVLAQNPCSQQEPKELDTSPKPTKISGILTSQIRSKPSSDVPYMVYLRPESANTKHSLKECEAQKCQSCEIPVVFKLREQGYSTYVPSLNKHCLKPRLNKGDSVILEGKFASSEYSERPSFTAYSYQIIDHGNN